VNDEDRSGSRIRRFFECPVRWRVAFGVYALILVTLTHWPKLAIAGPIPRTDLVAHLGAFGLWAMLLAGARWFGSAASPRNLLICGVIGVVYAAVDELTQGFEALGRTVALSDWIANIVGISMGLCAVLIVFRTRAPSGKSQ